MITIAEQFSNSHYFWQAAYLQDNPPLLRSDSYTLAMDLFDKLRHSAKHPLSTEQLNLYLFHLTDESLSRFSQNIQHFAPLSGNPHDLIYNDAIHLQINQDIH